MMKKIRIPFIALLFFILFPAVNSFAATFTFEFDDTAVGLDIAGFIWHFDCLETAVTTTQGPSIAKPWSLDANILPNDNILKVEALDWGAFFGDRAELSPGLIAKLDLPEEIKWSTNPKFLPFEFRDSTEAKIPVVYSGSLTEGGIITFSQVPIPSTLLLLGGGLFALIGGTRRKNGGK